MYYIHIVKRFRAHCGFYAIENKLLLLLYVTDDVRAGENALGMEGQCDNTNRQIEMGHPGLWEL